MNWRRGIEQLKRRLTGDVLSELDIYEMRLEDIEQRERFGSTEVTRAERIEVNSKLDDLAGKHLSVSFTDLCREAANGDVEVHHHELGRHSSQTRTPTARSRRCADLVASIDQTLGLIKQYEEQRRLSSDPKEQQRAERELVDLRTQLAAYEREQRELGTAAEAYAAASSQEGYSHALSSRSPPRSASRTAEKPPLAALIKQHSQIVTGSTISRCVVVPCA